MRGVVRGRQDLEDAKAVLPVGDEGEGAGGYHSYFYVIYIVELAIGGEELVHLRGGGIFDVNDGHALLAGGNVCVGTRDVDVARIGKRDEYVGDKFGLSEIGDIEDLHAVTIHDECVAELNCDGPRVVQERRGDCGGDFWG